MDLTDFFETNIDQDTKARKAASQRTASLLPGRDELGDDINWGDTGAIDHVLQGRTIEGTATTSVRALTDAGREAGALKLPVPLGTRVMFLANLGSVLSYDDIPGDKALGTVVTVRSASGDVTSHEGRVHVMWDDGVFRAIRAEHLRPVVTSAEKGTTRRGMALRMSFTSYDDLSSFFEPALGMGSKKASRGGTDLVHKATKDLWSFRQEGGEYVLERLFSEDGAPLKV